MSWGALATLGVGLLGSRSASKSNAAAANLDQTNRDWQDKNYTDRLIDTYGIDAFDVTPGTTTTSTIGNTPQSEGTKRSGFFSNITNNLQTSGALNKTTTTPAKYTLKSGSDQILRDRDFSDFTRTQESTLGAQNRLDQSRYGLERSARQEDFQHLRDQGLTAQEIVGSPIGGGVGGSAPSGQTLGSASATQAATAQAASDRAQARERSADRLHSANIEQLRARTTLASTAMQTGATLQGQQTIKDTATRGQDITEKGIILNAETIRRGQDIQKQNAQNSVQANLKIAKDKLALDTQKYSNIQLPQAINNIATSTPAWKRQEILAKMGVDNILATAMAGDFGLDPMNPDTLKGLSPQEFAELTRRIYGYSSRVFGEAAGASIIAHGAKDNTIKAVKSAAKKVYESIKSENVTPRQPRTSKATSPRG